MSGEGLNVLKGSVEIRKVGNTSTMDTTLVKILMRGQAIRNINREREDITKLL